jgi:hypothetical protein
MATNRRSFIRNIAIGAGASVASGLPEQSYASLTEKNPAAFNMCGFAAPKIPTVRIGIVGLGQRGPGAVERMSFIEGVEIKALCDKYPDRVTKAQEILVKAGLPKAKEYSGEEGWKALC